MIYILSESMMNGTVTMSTIVTGIEAPDFNAAKVKVNKLPNIDKFLVEETGSELRFRKKEKDATEIFNIYGYMKDEPLKII